MTSTLTPDDNRAEAASALTRAARLAPGTELYKNLVLTSIAHTLAAVAAYLEPPPVPQVPGLPHGYALDTRQSADGERKWGYALTFPDGRQHASRHRWETNETALGAGIRAAVQDQVNQAAGSQAAERAGPGNNGRIDVYGIANPAVD